MPLDNFGRLVDAALTWEELTSLLQDDMAEIKPAVKKMSEKAEDDSDTQEEIKDAAEDTSDTLKKLSAKFDKALALLSKLTNRNLKQEAQKGQETLRQAAAFIDRPKEKRDQEKAKFGWDMQGISKSLEAGLKSVTDGLQNAFRMNQPVIPVQPVQQANILPVMNKLITTVSSGLAGVVDKLEDMRKDTTVNVRTMPSVETDPGDAAREITKAIEKQTAKVQTEATVKIESDIDLPDFGRENIILLRYVEQNDPPMLEYDPITIQYMLSYAEGPGDPPGIGSRADEFLTVQGLVHLELDQDSQRIFALLEREWTLKINRLQVRVNGGGPGGPDEPPQLPPPRRPSDGGGGGGGSRLLVERKKDVTELTEEAGHAAGVLRDVADAGERVATSLDRVAEQRNDTDAAARVGQKLASRPPPAPKTPDDLYQELIRLLSRRNTEKSQAPLEEITQQFQTEVGKQVSNIGPAIAQVLFKISRAVPKNPEQGAVREKARKQLFTNAPDFYQGQIQNLDREINKLYQAYAFSSTTPKEKLDWGRVFDIIKEAEKLGVATEEIAKLIDSFKEIASLQGAPGVSPQTPAFIQQAAEKGTIAALDKNRFVAAMKDISKEPTYTPKIDMAGAMKAVGDAKLTPEARAMYDQLVASGQMTVAKLQEIASSMIVSKSDVLSDPGKFIEALKEAGASQELVDALGNMEMLQKLAEAGLKKGSIYTHDEVTHKLLTYLGNNAKERDEAKAYLAGLEKRADKGDELIEAVRGISPGAAAPTVAEPLKGRKKAAEPVPAGPESLTAQFSGTLTIDLSGAANITIEAPKAAFLKKIKTAIESQAITLTSVPTVEVTGTVAADFADAVTLDLGPIQKTLGTKVSQDLRKVSVELDTRGVRFPVSGTLTPTLAERDVDTAADAAATGMVAAIESESLRTAIKTKIGNTLRGSPINLGSVNFSVSGKLTPDLAVLVKDSANDLLASADIASGVVEFDILRTAIKQRITGDLRANPLALGSVQIDVTAKITPNLTTVETVEPGQIEGEPIETVESQIGKLRSSLGAKIRADLRGQPLPLGGVRIDVTATVTPKLTQVETTDKEDDAELAATAGIASINKDNLVASIGAKIRAGLRNQPLDLGGVRIDVTAKITPKLVRLDTSTDVADADLSAPQTQINTVGITVGVGAAIKRKFGSDTIPLNGVIPVKVAGTIKAILELKADSTLSEADNRLIGVKSVELSSSVKAAIEAKLLATPINMSGTLPVTVTGELKLTVASLTEYIKQIPAAAFKEDELAALQAKAEAFKDSRVTLTRVLQKEVIAKLESAPIALGDKKIEVKVTGNIEITLTSLQEYIDKIPAGVVDQKQLEQLEAKAEAFKQSGVNISARLKREVIDKLEGSPINLGNKKIDITVAGNIEFTLASLSEYIKNIPAGALDEQEIQSLTSKAEAFKSSSVGMTSRLQREVIAKLEGTIIPLGDTKIEVKVTGDIQITLASLSEFLKKIPAGALDEQEVTSLSQKADAFKQSAVGMTDRLKRDVINKLANTTIPLGDTKIDIKVTGDIQITLASLSEYLEKIPAGVLEEEQVATLSQKADAFKASGVGMTARLKREVIDKLDEAIIPLGDKKINVKVTGDIQITLASLQEYIDKIPAGALDEGQVSAFQAKADAFKASSVGMTARLKRDVIDKLDEAIIPLGDKKINVKVTGDIQITLASLQEYIDKIPTGVLDEQQVVSLQQKADAFKESGVGMTARLKRDVTDKLAEAVIPLGNKVINVKVTGDIAITVASLQEYIDKIPAGALEESEVTAFQQKADAFKLSAVNMTARLKRDVIDKLDEAIIPLGNKKLNITVTGDIQITLANLSEYIKKIPEGALDEQQVVALQQKADAFKESAVNMSARLKRDIIDKLQNVDLPLGDKEITVSVTGTFKMSLPGLDDYLASIPEDCLESDKVATLRRKLTALKECLESLGTKIQPLVDKLESANVQVGEKEVTIGVTGTLKVSTEGADAFAAEVERGAASVTQKLGAVEQKLTGVASQTSQATAKVRQAVTALIQGNNLELGEQNIPIQVKGTLTFTPQGINEFLAGVEKALGGLDAQFNQMGQAGVKIDEAKAEIKRKILEQIRSQQIDLGTDVEVAVTGQVKPVLKPLKVGGGGKLQPYQPAGAPAGTGGEYAEKPRVEQVEVTIEKSDVAVDTAAMLGEIDRQVRAAITGISGQEVKDEIPVEITPKIKIKSDKVLSDIETLFKAFVTGKEIPGGDVSVMVAPVTRLKTENILSDIETLFKAFVAGKEIPGGDVSVMVAPAIRLKTENILSDIESKFKEFTAGKEVQGGDVPVSVNPTAAETTVTAPQNLVGNEVIPYQAPVRLTPSRVELQPDSVILPDGNELIPYRSPVKVIPTGGSVDPAVLLLVLGKILSETALPEPPVWTLQGVTLKPADDVKITIDPGVLAELLRRAIASTDLGEQPLEKAFAAIQFLAQMGTVEISADAVIFDDATKEAIAVQLEALLTFEDATLTLKKLTVKAETTDIQGDASMMSVGNKVVIDTSRCLPTCDAETHRLLTMSMTSGVGYRDSAKDVGDVVGTPVFIDTTKCLWVCDTETHRLLSLIGHVTPAEAPSEEAIAARAKELWQKAGGGDRSDEESKGFWNKAVGMLEAEAQASSNYISVAGLVANTMDIRTHELLTEISGKMDPVVEMSRAALSTGSIYVHDTEARKFLQTIKEILESVHADILSVPDVTATPAAEEVAPAGPEVPSPLSPDKPKEPRTFVSPDDLTGVAAERAAHDVSDVLKNFGDKLLEFVEQFGAFNIKPGTDAVENEVMTFAKQAKELFDMIGPAMNNGVLTFSEELVSWWNTLKTNLAPDQLHLGNIMEHWLSYVTDNAKRLVELQKTPAVHPDTIVPPTPPTTTVPEVKKEEKPEGEKVEEALKEAPVVKKEEKDESKKIKKCLSVCDYTTHKLLQGIQKMLLTCCKKMGDSKKVVEEPKIEAPAATEATAAVSPPPKVQPNEEDTPEGKSRQIVRDAINRVQGYLDSLTSQLLGYNPLNKVTSDLVKNEQEFRRAVDETLYIQQGVTMNQREIQHQYELGADTISGQANKFRDIARITGQDINTNMKVYVKLLRMGIKDQKTAYQQMINASSVARQIGANAEETADMFGTWTNELGMSGNQGAQMARTMVEIGRSTGLSGDNLLRATKASGDLLKTLRNAGTLSQETARNFMLLSAGAQKVGISDEMNAFLKGAASGVDFIHNMDAGMRNITSVMAGHGREGLLNEFIMGRGGQRRNLMDLAGGYRNYIRQLAGVELEQLGSLNDQQRLIVDNALNQMSGGKIRIGNIGLFVTQLEEAGRSFDQRMAVIRRSMTEAGTATQRQLAEQQQQQLITGELFRGLTRVQELTSRTNGDLAEAFRLMTTEGENFDESFSQVLRELRIDTSRGVDGLRDSMTATFNRVRQGFIDAGRGAEFEITSEEMNAVFDDMAAGGARAAGATEKFNRLLTRLNQAQQQAGTMQAARQNPMTQLDQTIRELNATLQGLTSGALRRFIDAIGSFGLGLIALGSAVAMIFLYFIDFQKTLAQLGQTFGTAGQAGGLLGNILWAITNPFTAIGVAANKIAYAFGYLAGILPAITTAFKEFPAIKGIRDAFAPIVEWFAGLRTAIAETTVAKWIGGAFASIGESIGAMLGAVGRFFGRAGELIGAGAAAVWRGIGPMFESIGGVFSSLFSSIGGLFTRLWNTSVVQAMSTFVGRVGTGIIESIMPLLNLIGTKLSSIFGSFKFGEMFAGLTASFQAGKAGGIANAAGGIAKALGPVGKMFSTMGKILGKLAGPLAVVIGLFEAFTNPLKKMVDGVMKEASMLENITFAMLTGSTDTGSFLSSWLGIEKGTVADEAAGIMTAVAQGASMGFLVGGPWGAAIGALVGLLVELYKISEYGSSSLRQSLAYFRSWIGDIKNLIMSFVDLFVGAWNVIVGMFKGDHNLIQQGLAKIGNAIVGIIKNLILVLFKGIDLAMQGLILLITKLPEFIFDALGNLIGQWLPMTGVFIQKVGALLAGVGKILGGLWDIVAGLLSLDFRRVIGGFKAAIWNLIVPLLDAFSAIPEMTLEWIQTLGRFLLNFPQMVRDWAKKIDFKAIGKSLVEAISNGIKDFINSIREAFTIDGKFDWGAFGIWLLKVLGGIAIAFVIALAGLPAIITVGIYAIGGYIIGVLGEAILKGIGDLIAAIGDALMDIPGLQFLGAIFRGLGDIFTSLGAVIGGLVDIVGGIIGGLFTWDWDKAGTQIWNGVKKLFGGLGGIIIGLLQVAIPGIIGGALQLLADAVLGILYGIVALIDLIPGIDLSGWLSGLENAFTWVHGIVKGISDWFKWLFDVLVGHSIIPDLVNAVIWWFGGLFDVIRGFIRAVKGIFALNFGEFFGGIGDMAEAILKLPFLILKGIGNVGQAIAREARDWFTGIFDSLKGTFIGNIFSGTFDNLLGWMTNLTDAFSGLTTYFDGVIDVIQGIFDWDWNKVSDGFGKMAEGAWNFVKNFVQVVYKLPYIIKTAIYTLGAFIANAIGDWLTGISEVLADTPFGRFIGNVAGFFKDLGQYFSGLANYFQGIIDVISGIFSFDWGLISQGIGKIWDGMWMVVTGLAKMIIKLPLIIIEAIATLGEVIYDTLSGWMSGISQALGGEGTFLGGLFAALSDMAAGISKVFSGIKNIFGGVTEFFTGLFSWDMGKMGAAAERIWQGIQSIFAGLWQWIVAIPGRIIAWFQSIDWGAVGEGIRAFFAGIPGQIRAWVKGVNFKDWGKGIVAWIRSIPSMISRAFSNLFGGGEEGFDFKTFRDNMIQGLKNAIQGVINWFRSIDWKAIGVWLRELPGKIVEFIQNINWGDVIKGIGIALFAIFIAIPAIIASLAGLIIGAIGEAIFGGIAEALNQWAEELDGRFGDFIRGIAQVFQGLADIFGGIAEVAEGILTLDWDKALAGLGRIAVGIGEIFNGIWEAIWAAIGGVGEIILGWFGGIVEGILGFFGIDASGFTEGLIEGWNVFIDFMMNIPTNIVAGFATLWEGLSTFFSEFDWGTAFSGMVDFFIGLPGLIWDGFLGLLGLLWEGLAGLGKLFMSFLGNIGPFFGKLLKGIWDGVWGFLKALPGMFLNLVMMIGRFFGGLIGKIGKSVWRGAQWVWAKVKDIIEAMIFGIVDAIAGLPVVGRLLRGTRDQMRESGFGQGRHTRALEERWRSDDAAEEAAQAQAAAEAQAAEEARHRVELERQATQEAAERLQQLRTLGDQLRTTTGVNTDVAPGSQDTAAIRRIWTPREIAGFRNNLFGSSPTTTRTITRQYNDAIQAATVNSSRTWDSLQAARVERERRYAELIRPGKTAEQIQAASQSLAQADTALADSMRAYASAIQQREQIQASWATRDQVRIDPKRETMEMLQDSLIGLREELAAGNVSQRTRDMRASEIRERLMQAVAANNFNNAQGMNTLATLYRGEMTRGQLNDTIASRTNNRLLGENMTWEQKQAQLMQELVTLQREALLARERGDAARLDEMLRGMASNQDTLERIRAMQAAATEIQGRMRTSRDALRDNARWVELTRLVESTAPQVGENRDEWVRRREAARVELARMNQDLQLNAAQLDIWDQAVQAGRSQQEMADIAIEMWRRTLTTEQLLQSPAALRALQIRDMATRSNFVENRRTELQGLMAQAQAGTGMYAGVNRATGERWTETQRQREFTRLAQEIAGLEASLSVATDHLAETGGLIARSAGWVGGVTPDQRRQARDLAPAMLWHVIRSNERTQNNATEAMRYIIGELNARNDNVVEAIRAETSGPVKTLMDLVATRPAPTDRDGMQTWMETVRRTYTAQYGDLQRRWDTAFARAQTGDEAAQAEMAEIARQMYLLQRANVLVTTQPALLGQLGGSLGRLMEASNAAAAAIEEYEEAMETFDPATREGSDAILDAWARMTAAEGQYTRLQREVGTNLRTVATNPVWRNLSSRDFIDNFRTTIREAMPPEWQGQVDNNILADYPFLEQRERQVDAVMAGVRDQLLALADTRATWSEEDSKRFFDLQRQMIVLENTRRTPTSPGAAAVRDMQALLGVDPANVAQVQRVQGQIAQQLALIAQGRGMARTTVGGVALRGYAPLTDEDREAGTFMPQVIERLVDTFTRGMGRSFLLDRTRAGNQAWQMLDIRDVAARATAIARRRDELQGNLRAVVALAGDRPTTAQAEQIRLLTQQLSELEQANALSASMSNGIQQLRRGRAGEAAAMVEFRTTFGQMTTGVNEFINRQIAVQTQRQSITPEEKRQLVESAAAAINRGNLTDSTVNPYALIARFGTRRERQLEYNRIIRGLNANMEVAYNAWNRDRGNQGLFQTYMDAANRVAQAEEALSEPTNLFNEAVDQFRIAVDEFRGSFTETDPARQEEMRQNAMRMMGQAANMLMRTTENLPDFTSAMFGQMQSLLTNPETGQLETREVAAARIHGDIVAGRVDRAIRDVWVNPEDYATFDQDYTTARNRALDLLEELYDDDTDLGRAEEIRAILADDANINRFAPYERALFESTRAIRDLQDQLEAPDIGDADRERILGQLETEFGVLNTAMKNQAMFQLAARNPNALSSPADLARVMTPDAMQRSVIGMVRALAPVLTAQQIRMTQDYQRLMRRDDQGYYEAPAADEDETGRLARFTRITRSRETWRDAQLETLQRDLNAAIATQNWTRAGELTMQMDQVRQTFEHITSQAFLGAEDAAYRGRATLNRIVTPAATGAALNARVAPTNVGDFTQSLFRQWGLGVTSPFFRPTETDRTSAPAAEMRRALGGIDVMEQIMESFGITPTAEQRLQSRLNAINGVMTAANRRYWTALQRHNELVAAGGVGIPDEVIEATRQLISLNEMATDSIPGLRGRREAFQRSQVVPTLPPASMPTEPPERPRRAQLSSLVEDVGKRTTDPMAFRRGVEQLYILGRHFPDLVRPVLERAMFQARTAGNNDQAMYLNYVLMNLDRAREIPIGQEGARGASVPMHQAMPDLGGRQVPSGGSSGSPGSVMPSTEGGIGGLIRRLTGGRRTGGTGTGTGTGSTGGGTGTGTGTGTGSTGGGTGSTGGGTGTHVQGGGADLLPTFTPWMQRIMQGMGGGGPGGGIEGLFPVLERFGMGGFLPFNARPGGQGGQGGGMQGPPRAWRPGMPMNMDRLPPNHPLRGQIPQVGVPAAGVRRPIGPDDLSATWESQRAEIPADKLPGELQGQELEWIRRIAGARVFRVVRVQDNPPGTPQYRLQEIVEPMTAGEQQTWIRQWRMNNDVPVPSGPPFFGLPFTGTHNGPQQWTPGQPITADLFTNPYGPGQVLGRAHPMLPDFKWAMVNLFASSVGGGQPNSGLRDRDFGNFIAAFRTGAYGLSMTHPAWNLVQQEAVRRGLPMNNSQFYIPGAMAGEMWGDTGITWAQLIDQDLNDFRQHAPGFRAVRDRERPFNRNQLPERIRDIPMMGPADRPFAGPAVGGMGGAGVGGVGGVGGNPFQPLFPTGATRGARVNPLESPGSVMPGGILPILPGDLEPKAVGTPMVSQSGAAYLHKGEAILPATMARMWYELMGNYRDRGAFPTNGGGGVMQPLTNAVTQLVIAVKMLQDTVAAMDRSNPMDRNGNMNFAWVADIIRREFGFNVNNWDEIGNLPRNQRNALAEVISRQSGGRFGERDLPSLRQPTLLDTVLRMWTGLLHPQEETSRPEWMGAFDSLSTLVGQTWTKLQGDIRSYLSGLLEGFEEPTVEPKNGDTDKREVTPIKPSKVVPDVEEEIRRRRAEVADAQARATHSDELEDISENTSETAKNTADTAKVMMAVVRLLDIIRRLLSSGASLKGKKVNGVDISALTEGLDLDEIINTDWNMLYNESAVQGVIVNKS